MPADTMEVGDEFFLISDIVRNDRGQFDLFSGACRQKYRNQHQRQSDVPPQSATTNETVPVSHRKILEAEAPQNFGGDSDVARKNACVDASSYRESVRERKGVVCGKNNQPWVASLISVSIGMTSGLGENYLVSNKQCLEARLW
jgi:hypothetical protein